MAMNSVTGEIFASKENDRFLAKCIGVDTDDPAFSFTTSVSAAFILLHYFEDKYKATYRIEKEAGKAFRIQLEFKGKLFEASAYNEALAISRVAYAAFTLGK